MSIWYNGATGDERRQCVSAAEFVVRGPKPQPVCLSERERTALVQLARRPSTPQQLALRARIILAAADGLNNAQIARDLNITVLTARTWRTRWLVCAAASIEDLPVEERLSDAPRSGKPVRITAEQVCQILELACEAPERSGRPISQWTGREIADEVKARGIVQQISERHAARLLKRGTSNRTSGATG
jgi:putative transposase